MTVDDVAARRGAKLVRANGIDVAYTELGDGPPLVLLHGAFASTGPAWAGSPVAYVDHMFGGSPDATTADPDAAERAFQSVPPMAAIFATMKADYDQAQGEGHWRSYLGLFFDRATAPLGYEVQDFDAITAPTLILTGDRDQFCPVEAACVVYRTVEGGELGIVPNTDHEITSAALDTMIGFLGRHSA